MSLYAKEIACKEEVEVIVKFEPKYFNTKEELRIFLS